MTKEKAELTSGLDWLHLLKENWAWAAPLAYIYVTIAGMVQGWLHFRAFGINVFEFSEINDFLLAAFREPLSFLAILGLIAYSGFLFVAPRIFEGIQIIIFDWLSVPREPLKGAWGQLQSGMRRFFHWINIITSVLIVVGAPYYVPHIFHDGYGDGWKEDYLSNPNRKVSVIFKDIDKYAINREKGDAYVLIGTTGKFLFFYDLQGKQIVTTPIGSVLLIQRAELSNP